jgi:hypothetical protein
VLGLRGYRRSYTLPGESDRPCAIGGPAALALAPGATTDPSRAHPVAAGGRLARCISDVAAQVLGDSGGHNAENRSVGRWGAMTLGFALAAMGVVGD